MKELPEFFKSRVKENPETGCIEWQMFRNPRGYGQLTFQMKRWLAHRLCYVMAHGEIPEGLVVMHSCDNPACVNLNHLSLGTHRDNQYDKIGKGKNNDGERNGMSKLTVQDIVDIRMRVSRGETQRSLAKEYGVHPPCISRIVNNTRWRF